MAVTLLAKASGNFTTNTTWGLCDATSESDSEATTENISTTNLDSSAFIPGAITVDGVAIKVSSIITPTGTLTVTLRNSDLGTDTAAVTINCSDLNANANGWVFFNFGSTLLIAATNYKIRIARSVADGASNRVTLYVSASNNHSRQVRTTTNQAPAVGDKLIVCGEKTGAGTGNTWTVTMDDTSGTSYGATAYAQSVHVGDRGVWTNGIAASTTYTFKWAGIFRVCGGGVLNTGTIATPIPSTSTATYTMNVASNVDSGLVVGIGGTWNGRGNALTFVMSKLAADAAAAATSLTTVDSTVWLNGDSICLASTTQTGTQSEKKSLTAGASGTTLTITALTNAHSGTNNASGDIRGELGNLTRNVVFQGTSDTLQGYIFFDTTSVIDVQYVEIYRMGAATAGKRGIDVAITTGTMNFQFNSLHDFVVASSIGANFTGTSGSNLVYSNNVSYNISTQHISTVATSQVNVMDGNLCVLNTSGTMVTLVDMGMTLTNNTVAGGVSVGYGITMELTNAIGTWSGNVVHSCPSIGISFGGGGVLIGGTLTNWRSWRNSHAVRSASNIFAKVIVDGLVAFGNSAVNIDLQVTDGFMFKNCTVDAGATQQCPTGVNITSNMLTAANFETCTFGNTNTHSTGDIVFSNVSLCRLNLNNCKLASATEISNQAGMMPGSFVSSQKHDQTVGSHKAWLREGTITSDTTLFGTASPSMRMTPRIASEKCSVRYTYSGPMSIAVANGVAATIAVKVRESLVGSGDAATYNGARARLVLLANPAIGITSDTVIATATSASSGAWETISGTTAAPTDDGTMEFIVDCDGTTGWVNVDDFSCSAGNNATGAMKYWLAGTPLVVVEPTGGPFGGYLSMP